MVSRLCVFLLVLTCGSPLSAAIMVQVQNATITTGGTGFVDVLIESTGSDNLASFGLEFQISAPTINGALRFSAVQSSSETTAQAPPDVADYVFLGDSINFSAVRQDPNEQGLVGGDDASANVPINGTQRLLARLELEHITATPLSAIGDTFTISLLNTGSTYFADELLTPLSVDPFSFNSFGTVTITSAAAVPEPGTALFLVASSALGLFWQRRSVRRPAAESGL